MLRIVQRSFSKASSNGQQHGRRRGYEDVLCSSSLSIQSNQPTTNRSFHQFHTRKSPTLLFNTTTNPISKSFPLTKMSATASSFSTTATAKTTQTGKIEKSIEEQYSRKTPLEHILLRPGMYIGSVEKSQPSEQWIPNTSIPYPSLPPLNNNDNCSTTGMLDMTKTTILKDIQMTQSKISSHPALIKIFDEILVNAFDNRLRKGGAKQSTSQIDVVIHPGKIDEKSKTKKTSKTKMKQQQNENIAYLQEPYISITNNGKGIPIQIHKKEKMYLPEMLFGHLMTGSNFDDTNEKKLTGGRHGYGAKLTNIFSKMFEVETVDTVRKKKYTQRWTDNMKVMNDPIIEALKDDDSIEDYTKISFVPDLDKIAKERIDVGGEGDDRYQTPIIPMEDYTIMCRRVFDVAGCSGGKLKVTLNGNVVPVSSFEEYSNLFLPPTSKQNHLCFQKINARWEVGIGLSNSSSFEGISFVNGMDTVRGGTHVNVIVQQVTKRIADKIVKDYPELAETVTQSMVKRHLCVFVNSLIENPSFDSQMKEHLNTSPVAFGSRYTLSEKFLSMLLEDEASGGPGIVEHVVRTALGRQQANLINLVGGKKKNARRQLLNIPKLDDAHLAGSDDGPKCTLILTEGDSAKALAVAGLEVIGRENYGVFPLRGKFLNVRDAGIQQLTNNKEVKALCSILGLDFEKTYETQIERSGLRYGHTMLMTDQDADGSHIKGLIINFFRHFWPALLKPATDEPDGKPFLSSFVTPLIKATKKGKKGEVQSFFSMAEYNSWRSSLSDTDVKQWKIKYYKGLGTSTQAEGKEYFSDFQKHHRPFRWNSDMDGMLVDMVFEKSRADERRNWLRGYDETAVLVDPSIEESVTYEDFINKEMIHFSNADNMRSLPSVIDGLKPSQRKVLYACFKRNLKNEIKVAQLTGYCAEHTAYHHGEASLHATITGMAQDFVGSNNINLLEPKGQFGTRMAGGKDAASPRYIFTQLSPIARLLFPEVDDPLLTHLEDDGVVIEPKFYCPIVPLLLINGVQGIGTGWSSYIPSHNVKDVLEHVREKLNNQSKLPSINPWVRGFKGILEAKGNEGGYRSLGIIKSKNKSTIEIKELPVGKWTNDYKAFLLKMQKNKDIESFVENHTTSTVSFTITVKAAQLNRMKKSGLEKVFKLDSNMSLNNMHAFDDKYIIQKYTSPEEIVEAYFPIRMGLYHDRKGALESTKEYDAAVIRNKARFIEEVVDGKISLISGNKSKQDTIAELKDRDFAQISSLKDILSRREKDTSSESEGVDEKAKEFDYLLNMPLSSLTAERVESLTTEANKTESELREIQNATPESLWHLDLDKLEAYLKKVKI